MSRTSILLVFVAILLALNLVVTITSQVSGDAWTYAIISPADEKLGSELDKAGLMGYEVVSARRAGNGDSKVFSYEMILKRRLGFLEAIARKSSATK